MHKALKCVTFLLLAAALVFPGRSAVYGNALAQISKPGDLDPGFGSSGVVTMPAAIFGKSGSEDVLYALAVQEDGKIVAVGSAKLPTDNQTGVARFTPDGQLDPTFGSGGTTTLNFSQGFSYYDRSHALVIQADGKIVVGGCGSIARLLASGAPDPSFGTAGRVTLSPADNCVQDLAVLKDGSLLALGNGLYRYTPSGELDAAFGSGGVVGGLMTYAEAVDVQSDGKIVVGGFGAPVFYEDFMVMRFGADGAVDTGFGTNGKVTTNIQNDDFLTALVIQPDGKIVVGGSTDSGNLAYSYKDDVLVRYNADGSLDTTFGYFGVAKADLGTGMDQINDLALQSDGKLLASGFPQPVGFLSNGSLDPAFGTNGKAANPIPRKLYALALVSDGFVVGGLAGTEFIQDGVVAKYTSAGAAETSFGQSGAAKVNFLASETPTKALTPLQLGIDDSGGIVVEGYIRSDQSMVYFGLLRYEPDGAPDPAFGKNGGLVVGDGNFWSDYPGSFKGYSALAVQPDGKILMLVPEEAYGTSGHLMISLYRYTSSGAPDASFGTGGRVVLTPALRYGLALALQADGKILVYLTETANPVHTITRLNPDGSVDSAYGTNEVVTTPLQRIAMAAQPDSKLVAAGLECPQPWSCAPALYRYLANGALDTGFGNGGKVALPEEYDSRNDMSLALQPDGKILTYVLNLGVKQAARYLDNGQPDLTFGTQGQVAVDYYPTKLLTRSNNSFYTGQYVITDGSTDTLWVEHYLASGNHDPAFGDNGVAYAALGEQLADVKMQPDGKLVALGNGKSIVRFLGGVENYPVYLPFTTKN